MKRKVPLTSRQKIIEAAIAIFAAKGKYGATMEEIAARAQINKVMVYYYFQNKDNLFLQTLVYIFTWIFQNVMAPLSRFPDEDKDIVSPRNDRPPPFPLYSPKANLG